MVHNKENFRATSEKSLFKIWNKSLPVPIPPPEPTYSQVTIPAPPVVNPVLVEQYVWDYVSLGNLDPALYPGTFEVVHGDVGPLLGDYIIMFVMGDSSFSLYGSAGTDALVTPSLTHCTAVYSNEATSWLHWYVFEVTEDPSPDVYLELTLPSQGAGGRPGFIGWLVYTDATEPTIDDVNTSRGGGTATGPWSATQSGTALTPAGEWFCGFGAVFTADGGGGAAEFTTIGQATSPSGTTLANDHWFNNMGVGGSFAVGMYVPVASEETDAWTFTGNNNAEWTFERWAIEFTFSFA